jgi:hypothetical protein
LSWRGVYTPVDGRRHRAVEAAPPPRDGAGLDVAERLAARSRAYGQWL